VVTTAPGVLVGACIADKLPVVHGFTVGVGVAVFDGVAVAVGVEVCAFVVTSSNRENATTPIVTKIPLFVILFIFANLL